MDYVNGPRANQLVAGGPARLESWCVVGSDPTGVLIRPAGTIAFHYDGVHAWQNWNGTAAGWIALSDLVGSVPRIVHDADYTTVDHVALPTLDPTKRYRFSVRNQDEAGISVAVTVVPPSGNIHAVFATVAGGALTPDGLLIAKGSSDGIGPAGTGILDELVAGRHDWHAYGRKFGSSANAQVYCSGGVEGVGSYVGWLVNFKNFGTGLPIATSGHLRVVQESGGIP